MCKSFLTPRQGALKPLYHSLFSSFFFLFPLFFLSFSFLPLPTGIPTPLPSSKPSTSPTRTSPSSHLPSSNLLCPTPVFPLQPTASVYSLQSTFYSLQSTRPLLLQTLLHHYCPTPDFPFQSSSIFKQQSSPPYPLNYQHTTPTSFQLLDSDNSSSSLYPLHPTNIPNQSLPTPNPDTGSRPPSSNREGG